MFGSAFRSASKVAFLLLFVVCVAQSAFAASDVELFNAGRAALKKGDAEAAITHFENAIKIKETAEYQYWLGSAYGREAQKVSMLKAAGLAKKTKAAFERAVQLDPKYVTARMALVEYYLVAPGFMGGSVDKAREMAAEIKKLDVLMGHRAYARIHMKEKKPELARAELVTAVRAMPTSPDAHYFLGNMYANEKNYPAALHEYEYALKLDPNYNPAWFRIGWHAAVTNTDHARGEEAFKKYLAYTPKDDENQHSTTWYYLGMLYEKQGRKADARNAYQQALKLVPESKEVKEALKRVG